MHKCRANIGTHISVSYGEVVLNNRKGGGRIWWLIDWRQKLSTNFAPEVCFDSFLCTRTREACSLKARYEKNSSLWVYFLRWQQVLHPFTFFPLIVLCAIKKGAGQGPPIGSAYLPLKPSLNFMFTSGSPSPAVFLPLVSTHKMYYGYKDVQ